MGQSTVTLKSYHHFIYRKILESNAATYKKALQVPVHGIYSVQCLIYTTYKFTYFM
jgi:hypothetical protein